MLRRLEVCRGALSTAICFLLSVTLEDHAMLALVPSSQELPSDLVYCVYCIFLVVSVSGLFFNPYRVQVLENSSRLVYRKRIQV